MSENDVDTPSSTRPNPGTLRVLAGGATWQIIGQLFPLVINLALTPYIISGLGPERYSVFLLVSAVMMLVGRFDGGIGRSVVRYFSIYAGSGDHTALTRMTWTTTVISLVIGVIIALAAFLLSNTLLSFFAVHHELQGETTFFLRVLLVLVAVAMMRGIYSAILLAYHRYSFSAITTIIGHVIYTIGLILTVENGWGLRGMAYVFIAHQVSATIIALPPAVKYLRRPFVSWMHRDELKSFFRYAWKIQISGAITILSMQKDQIVAGRVLSAQLSGPYGQGSNFAQQLRVIPMNAVIPMQSLIGQAVGESGPKHAVAVAERIQRTWVRVTAAWVGAGVPATYFGVRAWLPDSYAIASEVAAILLVGTGCFMWTHVLKTWAMTLGHPEIDMRFNLVGLVANVALSFALGWPFGIIGVVVASSLSQMFAMFFVLWDANRVVDTPIRSFFSDVPWLGLVVAALLTLVLELAIDPIAPRHVWGLLTCGLLAIPGAVLCLVLAFGPTQVRRYAARGWRSMQRRVRKSRDESR